MAVTRYRHRRFPRWSGSYLKTDPADLARDLFATDETSAEEFRATVSWKADEVYEETR